MTASKTVVITGIGLLSSVGVGAAAHWHALETNAAPNVDAERFAPYPVHPMVEVDWSQQIPKRGDQRQMEAWQRIGTFTAGLALEDAGIKGDEALTSTMDMIIAAGGGERDVEVDQQILAGAASGANDTDVLINEKLTTELRPTLFLAQLSNLLAGNISIVHKVTGSSRTFMGEEGSGVSAMDIASARIRSGQSTHALVGGSFNAEHVDILLRSELAKVLGIGGHQRVFEQSGDDSGMITGSGGAFLVLEEEAHALARGATIYATVDAVAGDIGSNEKTVDRLSRLAEQTGLAHADFIMSAASGAQPRTGMEQRFLDATAKPYGEVTSLTGTLREAQPFMAAAVAALALKHGTMPKSLVVKGDIDAPAKIAVTTVGHVNAEGVVVLSRHQEQ